VLLLAVWSGHVRSRAAKVAAAAVIAVVTVVVAFARMYRGHHYPSDVVAGSALGLTWLVLTWVLVLRDQPAPHARERVQDPATSPA
jgi:membrane-associated phospholipid phosphatase